MFERFENMGVKLMNVSFTIEQEHGLATFVITAPVREWEDARDALGNETRDKAFSMYSVLEQALGGK